MVAAASEEGGVVVNGMSEHSRDGRNSNSAVVCSVFREDYGATPMKAIEFQRKIERAAFNCGGGDYSAPIITVGDFLEDKSAENPMDGAAFNSLREKLSGVLNTLNERERAVIEQRFGLKDGNPRTLEEVGRQFNVTRERIRQIEAKALRKLRHPTRIGCIKGFLDSSVS